MFGSLSKITVLLCSKRFAGHSKWANIKHLKATKDLQRAQLFINYAKKIKLAIHEGGSSDPKLNIQLEQAIEIAKKNSMPLSSIQNVIKTADSDKSKAKSMWYEIRGPGNSFLVVATVTENSKKTKDNITSILKKFRASHAERSCRHLFEHKGEVVANPPDGVENIDIATDHAIECGAEEVIPNESGEGVYTFVCSLDQLPIVASKLQVLKYNVISSDFNFIPTTKVNLSDEDMETLGKLIEKLQDHPDVISIYDNVA